MKRTTNHTKTYGSNDSKEAFYGPNSRAVYTCANSSVTRGVTLAPATFDECFTKFESVRRIAENLGFITGICSGISGACGGNESTTSGSCGPNGIKYIYDLWKGAEIPKNSIEDVFAPLDVYLDDVSPECYQIIDKMSSVGGEQWLGCLWGTPAISFSCTCPDIGPMFYAYLKLRLNVATFWNTPKNTPIKRAEFLDALKYGRKANITIAGDFTLKVGQVIELNVNAASGYPYYDSESYLNGLYYILGIKHVVTNSGTHETSLSISQIPAITTSTIVGNTYNVDYR